MLTPQQRRRVFWGLLPLFLGIQLIAAFVLLPPDQAGKTDFRAFYAGGYMIRSGYAHSFYDPRVQQEVQNKLWSNPGLLSASHPACEYLLLFVPLSFLKPQTAYWVFAIFNAGILIWTIHSLRRKISNDYRLLLTSLGFFPVWIAILKGQDSLVLLFLCVLAFTAEREWGAGFFLGLGLFKFQIVAPIALLYAIWRRWRFVGGLMIAAGILGAITMAVVGIPQSVAYVHFLAGGYGEQFRPGSMPNLRGLIEALGGRTLVVMAASAILLLYAVFQKPSFPLALCVGVLLSYHSLPHDLVLLLIPILTYELWLMWAGSSICLVPGFGYLASIPVLVEVWRWGRKVLPAQSG